MPGIPRPGSVRPARPPRFASAPLAEERAEALEPEPAAERMAPESERQAIRPQRSLEDVSPVRPTPTAIDEQPPRPPLPRPPSPILSSHARSEPQAPARAELVTNSRTADAPAPLVPGQSSQQPPQTTSDFHEVGEVAPILSVIATSRTPHDARPPLRQPLIQEPPAIAARAAATEIYVTIDRIDVRAPAFAASPASPAATKSRAASTLSLSDYLRQRGGGAR